jgi:hypothetical protein
VALQTVNEPPPEEEAGEEERARRGPSRRALAEAAKEG